MKGAEKVGDEGAVTGTGVGVGEYKETYIGPGGAGAGKGGAESVETLYDSIEYTLQDIMLESEMYGCSDGKASAVLTHVAKEDRSDGETPAAMKGPAIAVAHAVQETAEQDVLFTVPHAMS